MVLCIKTCSKMYHSLRIPVMKLQTWCMLGFCASSNSVHCVWTIPVWLFYWRFDDIIARDLLLAQFSQNSMNRAWLSHWFAAAWAPNGRIEQYVFHLMVYLHEFLRRLIGYTTYQTSYVNSFPINRCIHVYFSSMRCWVILLPNNGKLKSSTTSACFWSNTNQHYQIYIGIHLAGMTSTGDAGGIFLLYYTTNCLCATASQCLKQSSLYYSVSWCLCNSTLNFIFWKDLRTFIEFVTQSWNTCLKQIHMKLAKLGETGQNG